MLVSAFLLSSILAFTSVTITEPTDGETYDGDWLTVRAIIENENVVPDSVHYTLNGEPVIQIPRLNSDWLTYMQNQTRNGYIESVGPLDASILWTAPVTSFGHTFQSCVIEDGTVYYCEDSLYAFEAATGEVLWSYPIIGGDDAPLISGDRLYWASDSIYCFNLISHQPEWIVNGGDSGNSNPLIHNGNLYCGVVSSGIQGTTVKCLNSLDGSLVWQNLYSGKMQASFAIWNDELIFPTENGPLYAVDPESGDIIWENHDSEGGYWDTSPCIVDGTIYIGGQDSHIRAINASTGDALWSTEITPTFGIEATPAYHEGIVVCGSQTTFFAVQASDGSILWQIDKTIHGSPAIAGEIVYWGSVGDAAPWDSLYAANINTGEIIWSFLPDSLGWPLFSTPAIADGMMYYPAANGNLYAFGTGMKYTYLDDLYAQIGLNEFVVTSFDEGSAVCADTITFTVSGTGINLDSSQTVHLSAAPNPCHSSSLITFELIEPAYTTIQVFDLSGRKVVNLLASEMPSGSHSVQWDGYNQSGEKAYSGLYICRIRSGDLIENTGLCLLR